MICPASSVQLLLEFAVYGYMNGVIFKIFGITILIFEMLLAPIFSIGFLRLARSGELKEGMVLFFGFLLISTLIAVGLIRLQSWAAITASVVGLVWALIFARVAGSGPWQGLIVGGPVIVGLLTPLYATIRYWPSLKSIESPGLMSFVDALRSSDPLHLK